MEPITLIPEAKLKAYLRHCESVNEESGGVSLFCEKCGQVRTMKIHPYAYNRENNDIVFASVCPQCGELYFTKE